MVNDTVRVIVVRHCEAEGNVKRVFQGNTDSDITENGAAQLERLSERMRDVDFDIIYSSPLIRAFKTAQAANKYHNRPIIKDSGLKEINGGEWEGTPWGVFDTSNDEQTYNWQNEPHNFTPKSGESMREVFGRMRDTVLKIARRHPGQTVVISTHGCALRNLLCWAKGRPIEELKNIGWCDNTGISVIEINNKLEPTILVENDASHLDESISTFAKQDWWKLV